MSLSNPEFQKELTQLLNKHSVDTDLATPDYMIAGTICLQLMSIQALVSDRDKWFGFKPFEAAEAAQVQDGLIDPNTLVPQNG